jgi:predicted O-methyltransferase YrrM
MELSLRRRYSLRRRALPRRTWRQLGCETWSRSRIGDALETLRELPGAVDVLFLDGWNKLYLPVLQIVEPQLAPNALVVADYSKDDPTLVPYQEYVRDPSNGYFSTLLPLDDGVELSVRV